MRYLIALLCPPLAILMCGRPFLAIFSIILLIGYLPAALLALLVVSAYLADKRNQTLIVALDKNTRKTIKATTKSQERQTKLAAGAMDRQSEAIGKHAEALHAVAASNVSPSTQPPVASPQPALQPVASTPRRPLITLAQIKQAIHDAKTGAIFAYQNLPEWAQPISWGLAAGSVPATAFALFMIFRR